jgi:hypothetical protein
MLRSSTCCVLLTLALLGGCKDEPKRHGPALTPLTANQLKALAGECEFKPAKSDKGTKELRLCKGRQALMTIHLDENRNLIAIEIGLWAPMRAEAKLLLEQTMRGIVSDKALAAMSDRLGNTKSDPVWIDNVRVNAFQTQAPNENPRYTADFSWR